AEAQRAFEATIPRWSPVVLAKVPFARHRGEVASVAEHFGDREGLIVVAPCGAKRPAADDVVEMPHARLVRIQPGEQARARRRAARRGIELGESHAPR